MGAVTPIQNQGSCGACWAFVGVAAAESHVIIKNRATNSTIGLSEQYLLRCTSGSNCAGGYIEDGMQNIVTHGCPLRSSYPYNPTDLSTTLCASASSYFGVATSRTYYTSLTDTQMITLLQTSPLAIGVASTDFNSYTSGILTCNNNALDHAVLLVGYDTNYWYIKNSWGTSWGLAGFAKITRTRTQPYTNCRIG